MGLRLGCRLRYVRRVCTTNVGVLYRTILYRTVLYRTILYRTIRTVFVGAEVKTHDVNVWV